MDHRSFRIAPLALLASLPLALAASATGTFTAPRDAIVVTTQETTEVELPAWKATDQLARCFALASTGDFEAALASLAGMRSAAKEGELPERTLRFEARLIELQALRHDYLTSLATNGKKLTLARDGKKASARVLGVTKTTIQFEANKRFPAELPIEVVPLATLSKQIRKVKPAPGSIASRGLLEVLAGSEHWKKRLLKDLGDAGDPDQLETDFAQIQPLLLHGAIVVDIDFIAGATGAPSSNRITRLRALLAANGSHSVIEGNKYVLHSAAFSLFHDTFVDADIASILKTADVTITGDTLRMAYDFSDAAQLHDFLEVESSGSSNYISSNVVTVPEKQWQLEVKAKALHIYGEANLRHRIPLTSPCSMEVISTVNHERPDGASGEEIGMFLALCDDSKKTYTLCSIHAGYLKAAGPSSDKLANSDSTETHGFNQKYTTKITLKERVLTGFDGEERSVELKNVAADSGHAQLLFRTDYRLTVHSIVLEGTLDAKIRADLAIQYADIELAALGL